MKALLFAFWILNSAISIAAEPAKPAAPAAAVATAPAAPTVLLPTNTPQVPSSCDPRAGGHQIPNQRELTAEDYQLLGRIAWQELQNGPQKEDLTEADVAALVDQAERNRQEVTLTLEELYQLMKSPALCGPQQATTDMQPKGMAIEMPLDPQSRAHP